MKIIILGVDEEASILANFLKEKEIYVKTANNFEEFKQAIGREKFDACVIDVEFKFNEEKTQEELVLELKEKYSLPRVYCMSYFDDDNYDLPLHEDGHLYKPLTKKDLEIFYRVLTKDEKMELVCLFFGLRFYASPERAKLLKARIEDFLLKNFEHEGLLGIDVHYPPVDLTPTFTKATTKKAKKPKNKK